MKKQIPELLLEKYVLEELSPVEKKFIDEQLESDNLLIGRIEEIRRTDKDILSRYSPDFMASQIERKMESELRRGQKTDFLRSPVFRFSSIIATAAILLVLGFQFLAPLINSSLNPNNTLEETIRLKGETSIRLYRQVADSFERLKNGASVSSGDSVQISYTAGNKSYGAILSIDGNGMVTLHYPDRADLIPLLDKEGEVPLKFAYELDDAPDFERFFLIASDNSFNVDLVMKEAESLARDLKKAKNSELVLDKIGGKQTFKQTTFLLKKEK